MSYIGGSRLFLGRSSSVFVGCVNSRGFTVGPLRLFVELLQPLVDKLDVSAVVQRRIEAIPASKYRELDEYC